MVDLHDTPHITESSSRRRFMTLQMESRAVGYAGRRRGTKGGRDQECWVLRPLVSPCPLMSLGDLKPNSRAPAFTGGQLKLHLSL